jgi:hypothetical protein
MDGSKRPKMVLNYKPEEHRGAKKMQEKLER